MKKYITLLTFLTLSGFCFAEDFSSTQNNLFTPNQPTNIQDTSCLTNQSAISAIHEKCKQLVQRMYEDRAATYNVLNLTPQQKKCNENIEKRRFQELDFKITELEKELYLIDTLQCNPEINKFAIKQQNKIVKNIKKDINKIMKKYDNEFKSILSGQQKSKYNLIKKMKNNDIKRCEKNKSLFKKDENLQPFGIPYYFDEENCPKHGKRHLFGRKCKLCK